MPELPELEVVRQVLERRVVGHTIEAVELVPPGAAIVVRDLTRLGCAAALTGACLTLVERRGKFLHLAVARPQIPDPPLHLLINFKLMGRLQLATPADKRRAKTHVILSLSGGVELRYVDPNQMGQIYLLSDLGQIPDYAHLGPEPLAIPLADFCTRLRSFRGEIKGILTRGEFVAGIGNAYADEILWAAQIHPYRKRTQLTAAEVERLYRAMQTTLVQAVDHVRREVGEEIHLEPRGFLSVHMKTGQPCPRCGTPISLISANQRITNFCRTCQPGGLIRGM